MNLDQEIQSQLEKSVFIDGDLKDQIIAYLSNVGDEEKRELLSMIQKIEKEKDRALEDAMVTDEQKYKDFHQMIKAMKKEKVGMLEEQSKEGEVEALQEIEKEINLIS